MFGLKMGANFIRKPFSQRLLVERVKAVLRRAAPKDIAATKEANSSVLERGLLRMDPERHTCTWKNETVTGGVDPQIQTANLFISFSDVGGQRAAVAHSEVVQQTPLIRKMKVATAAR